MSTLDNLAKHIEAKLGPAVEGQVQADRAW